MKMKRLAALALSGAMALSLATSAMAASTTTDVTDPSKGANIKVTGTALVPTIKITVPTSAGVVLNPYGMTIKDNSGTWALDDSGSVTDKVVSSVSNIVNLSDVAIKVGVSATATVPAGVTLAKASAAGITGKDKQVFVKMQMITADDVNSGASDFGTPAGEIILATTAASLKTPISLAKSSDNSSPDAGGVLAFRFTGDTSAEPTTAWTAKDTVTATVAFTFTPVNAS